MNITLNGKPCDTNAGNIISLLEEKNYRPELVAVEVNEDIIAKEGYRAYSLKEGDTVEIVTFMGGGEEKDTWFLGEHEFSSRFILGSGKYSLKLISAAGGGDCGGGAGRGTDCNFGLKAGKPGGDGKYYGLHSKGRHSFAQYFRGKECR